MLFKKEEIEQAIEQWEANRALGQRVDQTGTLSNQAQRLTALIVDIRAQIRLLQQHLAPLEEHTNLMLSELRRLQALLADAMQQAQHLQEKLAQGQDESVVC